MVVQDMTALEQVDALIVPPDKQARLECHTRGLDYLDKV